MNICIEVQERIALEEPLSDSERAHLADCQRCTRVAETYSLLDESLERLVEQVPEGFADRVLIRLAAQEGARSKRWLDTSWAEIAFANLALFCALLNTLHFLAGVLIPTVSLGGTP
jgi:hypothetical protein